MYEKFLEILQNLGGRSSNRVMMEITGWEKNEYLSVRDALVADKKIKLGRGRGGSVILIEETNVQEG
jgi:type I restriction enzyme M protein